MRAKHAVFAVLVAATVAGCGGAHYTIVPPAVDLTAFESVGLVTFKSAGAKGDLDAVATQHFLEEVTAAQRVPVVELGPADKVLAETGRAEFDREAVRAIGEKQGVDAVFIGEITVTKVKPQLDLAAPLSRTLFARTAMDMTVKARLVSAKNGATVWTSSATRQGTVGTVGIEEGVPVFSVRDKSAATNDLLRRIMYQMTWDFRPTQQRVR
jgi:hypothetical protein